MHRIKKNIQGNIPVLLTAGVLTTIIKRQTKKII